MKRFRQSRKKVVVLNYEILGTADLASQAFLRRAKAAANGSFQQHTTEYQRILQHWNRRRSPILSLTSILSRAHEQYYNRALCSSCRMILRECGKQRLDAKPQPHISILSATSEVFEDIMNKNCAFCVLFVSVLTFQDKASLRRHKSHIGAQIEDGEDFETRCVLIVEDDERILALYHQLPDSDLIIRYIHLKIPESLGYAPVQQQPLATIPGSGPALATAMQWISDCLENHSLCGGGKSKPHIENGFLPTRLIDVGDDSSTQVKLCGRSAVFPRSRYVTLSHCWGSHVPVTLTMSSLESMTQGICLAKLPKTFQEALQVTRLLGARYIWIDALCIIQDSDDDWQKESVLMHLVYSNSYCNVAATASADGNGGLFFERCTLSLQPFLVRTAGRIFTPQNSQVWQQSVEDAPLSKRAWVFQERFLAPRNLHFTSTQLCWECNEKLACESFPTGLPTFIHRRGIKRRTSNPSATVREVLGLSTSLNQNPYNTWSAIVEDYSRGCLTRDTDKLVAIGGIAAKMQENTNDSYLAGLWWRYLENELLWVAERHEKHERPKEYIAPSWSWASITGEIEEAGTVRQEDKRDILAHVIDAEILYASTSFGKVTAGSVRLQCRLAVLGFIGRGPFILIGRDFSSIDLVIHRDITALDGEWLRPEEDASVSKLLYCMPLRNDEETYKFPAIGGLILESADNRTLWPKIFRRYGTFFAHGEEVVRMLNYGCDSFDCATKLCQCGQDNSESTCGPTGSSRHTITII